jgi:hypothetical protein
MAGIYHMYMIDKNDINPSMYNKTIYTDNTLLYLLLLLKS